MDIELFSGIRIKLYEITQKFTYEGLLEGLPTKSMNENIKKSILTEYSQNGKKAYLIEPEEKLINIKRKYPFGEPAEIPQIVCIARFESDFTKNEPILNRTTSRIIWFQDKFVLPIDERCLHKIKQIDWPSISEEYEI